VVKMLNWVRWIAFYFLLTREQRGELVRLAKSRR